MQATDTQPGWQHVATFCGQCNCGCPELYVATGAPTERSIVITDDFGQKIEMSHNQLETLITDIKTGALDALLSGA